MAHDPSLDILYRERAGLLAPDVPSPGPWTGDDAGNVRDAEGRLVAQLMRKADMARVVAVNELLDALTTLYRWCDDNVEDPAVTVPLGIARAAIGKALGDAP